MQTATDQETTSIISSLIQQYATVRKRTEGICSPLVTEDYVAQPIVDVSPPKWHIGHTSWFFETFILEKSYPSYQVFDPQFSFVFNSYYESVGKRVGRVERGTLTRPTVEKVYEYRQYVDRHIHQLLNDQGLPEELIPVFQLGLQHEQQHQELLLTDIKYILGKNPLFPVYNQQLPFSTPARQENSLVLMEEGQYEIGFKGEGFCFDNELNPHTVFLPSYSIHNNLVTNGEFIAFIEAGGYGNFRYWHAEGWDWVNQHQIEAPEYWHKKDGEWYHFTLVGLKKVDPEALVCHVSFYEASAYAEWKGKRLPTEFEWEAASGQISWGQRWEWTNSAYLPYPGFQKPEGAVGEYNGKFMINQMVLRGASVATSPNHSRPTYRNFFHPNLRWQYTGIRLAEK